MNPRRAQAALLVAALVAPASAQQVQGLGAQGRLDFICDGDKAVAIRLIVVTPGEVVVPIPAQPCPKKPALKPPAPSKPVGAPA